MDNVGMSGETFIGCLATIATVLLFVWIFRQIMNDDPSTYRSDRNGLDNDSRAQDEPSA